MKAWKFIWGPLIILVMSVTACSSAANRAVRPVQQITAIRGDLITNISGNGKISIVTDAKLSFGSGGKLATLNVKEGDRVTNGQVLAKLDTSALELAQAQGKVAQDQAQEIVRKYRKENNKGQRGDIVLVQGHDKPADKSDNKS